MFTETIKIPFTKPNLSYSDREKTINTEIQKIMDSYNSKGFIVISHSILNKTDSNASVNFNFKKMIG